MPNIKLTSTENLATSNKKAWKFDQVCVVDRHNKTEIGISTHKSKEYKGRDAMFKLLLNNT